MKDPICGMDVLESSPWKAEKDGKTFYFCCDHCRKKFLAPKPALPSFKGPRIGLTLSNTPGSSGASILPAAIPELKSNSGSNTHSCCSSHGSAPAQTAARPANGPTAQGAYFCPMCPEVRSDKPASCPKCGMPLELDPTAVSPADRGTEQPDPELADMAKRCWIGALFTAPVFILAMAHLIPSLAEAWHTDSDIARWLQFFFSVPVVGYSGAPIFQKAWASVRSRHWNMFTLIALGVIAAFGFSTLVLFAPHLLPHSMGTNHQPGVYFEAATVVIVLVLLGQVLESKARSKTGAAIQSLIRLSPPTARKMVGKEDLETPLEEIRIGDRLRVRPGDRVPLDGRIIEGESAVDESMVTGEALPKRKGIGSSVTGGTVNTTGSFVMEVTRTGRDTLLGQIIQQVAESQRSRAPIQALADQVSQYFVPTVVACSVLTFFLWMRFGPEPRWGYAVVNSVAVLIIACPCALGLATPMSVMIGIGRGAQEGILIRNAEALQRLSQVGRIAFDKTGTLTQGTPEVTRIEVENSFSADDLLQIAASVEHQSEHPLARAIVKSALHRGLGLQSCTDFQSEPGFGVTGIVGNKKILLGNTEWMTKRGVTLPETWLNSAKRFQELGLTAIYVALDGSAAGVLGISDPTKPGAADVLRTLGAKRLKVTLLTGDHPLTAAAVARELGIETFRAGLSPLEKARTIREWQAQGGPLAMVGDGVNDAVALSEASVGIAMGNGSDIALQSAGMTLLGGQLEALPKAVQLSQATMTNIRQNLVFALLFNGLGIPIAAGVLYPVCGLLLNPMIAGAAMSFSSLFVVGNALRLQRLKFD